MFSKQSESLKLTLLGGHDAVNRAIFENWTTIKARYQFYLASSGQRDNIQWAALEADHYPQSRVTDLFKQCWNQGTLGLIGRALEEKLPRVHGLLLKEDGGDLFAARSQSTGPEGGWISPPEERLVYALLNQKRPDGNDWRQFAYLAGFRSNYETLMFGQSDNPCEAVVLAWRAVSPQEVTRSNLVRILASMSR